jgi:hypothetical protein
MYNQKHLEKIVSESRLPNVEKDSFQTEELGQTEINISGKICKVLVFRNTNGNIEICPIDEGITDKGGWLEKGTCTQGFNDEVIIYQYED